MFKVSIILICIFFLTGCWDRNEINDVAFVLGSSFDMEEDKYRITLQIPLPGQMGGAGSEGGGGGTSGGKSWYNETEVASSIRKANETQQQRASRELYFAHRRVIILGEDLAKSGIDDILDVSARVPQNRLTTYVVVAKGNGHETLTADVPIERNPSEMVRELANFSIKNPRTIKELTHILLTEGIDPALPVVSVKELPQISGGVKETLEMGGLAVFSGSKLTGFLEGDNAEGVLWGMNEVNNPEIVVPPPNGEGEINIRFTETDTEINPIIDGENITVEVKIRAKGTIIENKSDFDPTEGRNLYTLEDISQEKIKSQVKNGVELLQKELNSDAIGFGHIIYLNNPREWKKMAKRWREIYPNVKVEVITKVHIEHSGSLNNPLGIKEKEQIHD